jgi:hypothetical protein
MNEIEKGDIVFVTKSGEQCLAEVSFAGGDIVTVIVGYDEVWGDPCEFETYKRTDVYLVCKRADRRDTQTNRKD